MEMLEQPVLCRIRVWHLILVTQPESK